MGESRRRTGSRAVGLLQVPPKPVAALSVDGHRPHRGSGGAAPGRGERAVVDGVEAELVVELRDECDGVGVSLETTRAVRSAAPLGRASLTRAGTESCGVRAGTRPWNWMWLNSRARGTPDPAGARPGAGAAPGRRPRRSPESARRRAARRGGLVVGRRAAADGARPHRGSGPARLPRRRRSHRPRRECRGPRPQPAPAAGPQSAPRPVPRSSGAPCTRLGRESLRA